MFWENIETIKERTLQQMVAEPTTRLDEILSHDFCFQELRIGSKYLADYFTRSDILDQLLNRSLFFKPDPNAEPLLQYKASPRALAILTMGCKAINEAISSNSEIVQRLINYLKPGENSFANDVTTGFYKHLIISMLDTFDTAENLFLDALEKSNFMELCFNAIEFGAIAELVVRIPTHCTNLDFQKRIFDWYANCGVAKHLIDLYTADATMNILENAGFMWSEFNDMQLRHVETAEAFTKVLYSPKIVKSLTERAFSSLEKSSPMLINYISPILVSFIELNRVENEPGFKSFPDLYMREPTLDLGDPEFRLQSEIVTNSQVIMQVIFKAWEAPISNGLTLTAVSCLKIIRALTNTNHLETHKHLAKVFSDPETSIFKLLDYPCTNPTSSICNNHIMAIFAHTLWTNTEKEHALIDCLFKTQPKTIIGSILEILEKYQHRKLDEPDLLHLARQTFFLKIGEYVNLARAETSERAIYLNDLVNSLGKETDAWNNLSNSALHSFSEYNRTYSVGNNQSTRTIGEALGDIDEVANTEKTEKTMQTLAI